ncbi:hypothetical protein EV356DRAFT_146987 [Viridothelium virens]|uniref:Secreted protein n=1 Tax=Viridothelium virens TaxID=1048519 RepID=A0A6A6H9F6_VIRVR|nr:hypothetical protein EV356DRAFT_146987 [Viridothelium virens]
MPHGLSWIESALAGVRCCVLAAKAVSQMCFSHVLSRVTYHTSANKRKKVDGFFPFLNWCQANAYRQALFSFKSSLKLFPWSFVALLLNWAISVEASVFGRCGRTNNTTKFTHHEPLQHCIHLISGKQSSIHLS